MANFKATVRGKITRLYPGGNRFYFHVSGDESPYGYTESDYNFILCSAPHFQSTYQLLLKAAEHNWEVIVQRSESMQDHIKINDKWTHYNIAYVYVDFKNRS